MIRLLKEEICQLFLHLSKKELKSDYEIISCNISALERLHHELFDTSRKKEKGYDMAFWNENTQGTGGNPNEKPINHVVFNEPSCFYAHPWE